MCVCIRGVRGGKRLQAEGLRISYSYLFKKKSAVYGHCFVTLPLHNNYYRHGGLVVKASAS